MMTDTLLEREAPAAARRNGRDLGALAALCLALTVAGPWLFDTYLLNVLIKALFFAIAAVTVDPAVGAIPAGRCWRAGLHAFRLLARSGGAGCAGGGAGLGGAGAGDGLAVLLPGSLAVLRHGDIAGAAYRADQVALSGGTLPARPRADRLRQLRPVAAGLVRGGGGRAVGGGAAGLDGDRRASDAGRILAACATRIALQLPGAGHGAGVSRCWSRAAWWRRWRASATAPSAAWRAELTGFVFGTELIIWRWAARHDLGAGAGRDPDQPWRPLPERLHALRVAVAAGRDLHRGHPAAAARAAAAAAGAETARAATAPALTARRRRRKARRLSLRGVGASAACRCWKAST